MTTQNLTLLDPTSERTPASRSRVPRPVTLDGLTIGLIDISKARGNIFLTHLTGLLEQRGLNVKLYRKPTYTRVAPLDLQQTIAMECDVVIEALAD